MSEASERLKEARERDEAVAQDEAPADDAARSSEAQDASKAQAAQPTEKQIDRAFESASASAARNVEKVAKLIGLPADGVLPCPCCDVPGYVFAGRAPLDGERLMAVKAMIGEDDLRTYRAATNAVECEACDGYGKLVRPTKVRDQILAVCTVCNGYGWHAPSATVVTYQQPEQPQVYYPPTQQQQYNGPQPVYSVPPQG